MLSHILFLPSKMNIASMRAGTPSVFLWLYAQSLDRTAIYLQSTQPFPRVPGLRDNSQSRGQLRLKKFRESGRTLEIRQSRRSRGKTGSRETGYERGKGVAEKLQAYSCSSLSCVPASGTVKSSRQARKVTVHKVWMGHKAWPSLTAQRTQADGASVVDKRQSLGIRIWVRPSETEINSPQKQEGH